jgi:hypothetical protein
MDSVTQDFGKHTRILYFHFDGWELESYVDLFIHLSGV